MIRDRVLKQLAVMLVCLLSLHPLLAVSACAAVQRESALGGRSMVSAGVGLATLADASEIPEEWATGKGDEAAEADDVQLVDDMFATPSTATPSTATPSDASREIVWIDVPDLVALEAGAVEEAVWQDAFPKRAEARTGSRDEIWCDLHWTVPYTEWDQPGILLARAEVILPEGYTLKGPDSSYEAVVSIRPQGMSQVMDVFTFMRYGMKGHSWTFAMKAGQDMTPLTEALENITYYNGILDDPAVNISFLAEWDFSSVDSERPGIYPIYRSLTLVEDSLPDGVSPEDIYLPEYWRSLPVLFTVEEPGGPQLYGVLESPYDFFGSYARLTGEALGRLEVWYSVDGGRWTLQTGEGLMDTFETNFFIHKEAMAEGRSYAFRLRLGDFVSRELTVQKDGDGPVWFSCTIDGNRDGTIEVEFPTVSQPLPIDPDEGETNPPSADPDEGETNPPPADPDEGETNPPSADPDEGETNPPPAESDEGETSPPFAESDGGETSRPSAEPGEEETKLSPEAVSGGETNPPPTPDFSERDRSSETIDSPPGIRSESHTAEAEKVWKPTASAPLPELSQEDSQSSSLPVPEETVTRWTTRISGRRVRKLIELYPEWVLFQKEEVTVLLSSQWLVGQKMGDSDILTVSVSPGEDHTVTIWINEKEPQPPPVFQVRIGEKGKDRFAGMDAIAVLTLALAGVMAAFQWRRRWRN